MLRGGTALFSRPVLRRVHPTTTRETDEQIVPRAVRVWCPPIIKDYDIASGAKVPDVAVSW